MKNIYGIITSGGSSKREERKNIPKKNKYILLSGVNTGIQSVLSALSSGILISRLSILNNVTMSLYNIIGRDALGQLGGAVYAYNKGNVIKESPRSNGTIANSCILFSQFSEIITCYSSLTGFKLLTPLCLFNVGKNIGWIGTGAVNTHYMAKISDDNIAEMYTHMSVVNSISSTIGMFIGLSLSSKVMRNKRAGIIASLLLSISSGWVYNRMLETVE